LLRGSINLYLRLLKKGDDGKLHLPVQHSPEYGDAADNNYNLALLRWGCQTLIDLNQRYRLNDPLVPRWQETLASLTPYPVDENGLRIGADVAFTKSHRHWSHMLMVHPLHIMDANDPANRDLLYKSIHHWLTVDGSRGVYGWSRAAAASLYAALGDGDNAIASIHQHMADKRFVRPNTMYIEGSPVIECSIVLARSLQDMLLQSHNNIIRVFPAVPAAWTNAAFHNFLAEGAFLVSAERKNGRTQWVRVKSLAGEPCRIQFDGNIHELRLAQGEERFLGKGPAVLAPLPISPADANPHGFEKVVSAGKRATASSVWGKGFEADKAFDGNYSTRWGAKQKSRSGWLEVDLGAPTPVSRAIVVEFASRRTEQFAIEYKDGDTWKPLVTGTSIDSSKSFDFPPVTARYFRLNILKANEVPTITEFQLFNPAK